MHIFRVPCKETHRAGGQRHEGRDHYLRRQTQPRSPCSTRRRWKLLQRRQSTCTRQHSNASEAIRCRQPFFPDKFSGHLPGWKYKHVRNRSTSSIIIIPVSDITRSAPKFSSFRIWNSRQGRGRRQHVLQLISILDYTKTNKFYSFLFSFFCSFVKLIETTTEYINCHKFVDCLG